MAPNPSTAIPDLSGNYIDNGRYQLLNPLGKGSYGVVYRARERLPNTQRSVLRAIKVVRRAPPTSGRGTHQTREAMLHGCVSGHPNVVSLHRVLRDQRYLYYVMDFCAGGDLFHQVGRRHVFARNDALVKSVFLQILDGVESCHKKRVFHRDLKPENILANEDLSRVFIADFGLATQGRESISFNTGTRYYMGPENVDCDDRDYPYDTRRNDVWALGLILVNFVTGRLPWCRATIDDPLFLAYLENPEYLRLSLPISSSLNDLLHHIFTIRPQDCMSIAEFRTAVSNIETFWMSEEELRASNDVVRQVWRTYDPRPHPRRVPVPPQPQQAKSTDASSESEDEGDELASDTSSESTNADGSTPVEEPSPAPAAVPSQVQPKAEEEGCVIPPPLPLTSPPKSPAEPPVLIRPIPRTATPGVFPLQYPESRPACMPKNRAPATAAAPVQPPSTEEPESDGPATPQMCAQVVPDVVIAEPLDETVSRVERAAIARVSQEEKEESTGSRLGRLFAQLVAKV